MTVECHPSYFADFSVLGCPASCDYCFLPRRNSGDEKEESTYRHVAPKIIQQPNVGVNELIQSPFYQREIPIALGVNADLFTNQATMSWMLEYLNKMLELRIHNPVVLITKRKIPDEILHKLADLQQSGANPVVLLSYSGLSNEVEHGVNHKVLIDNFTRLHEGKIPAVHYWRPLIPINSTIETMRKVIQNTGNVPHVVLGLSLNSKVVQQMSVHWKELGTIDLSAVSAVIPKQALVNLVILQKEFPEHTFFSTTSCAITSALNRVRQTRRADYAGTWSTPVCNKHNNCSVDQRMICANSDRDLITQIPVRVRDLQQRGIEMGTLQYIPDAREVVVDPDIVFDENTLNGIRLYLNALVKGVTNDGHYAFSQQSYGTLRETII